MILLSFDIEEFDVPREHGLNYPLDKGIEVSSYGANLILDCLKKNNVKATFFCTTIFATHSPEIIRRIKEEGHEIASHGCNHWEPKAIDVALSKQFFLNNFGIKVNGYRQPRMFPVSDRDIKLNGYLYNSSLNPAFIPGRYMHLSEPRTIFKKNDLLQIPASVTPIIRFPLFWLSYHILPSKLYRFLAYMVWKHDGYFVTYFHPWEFFPLNEHPEMKIPFIIRYHSGEQMLKRLDDFIIYFKNKGAHFTKLTELAQTKE